MIKKLFSRTHLVFLLLLAICVITYDATADTVQYTYDDAGRLIEADFGDKVITYTYDNAGNLLERKVADPPVNVNPVPDVKAKGPDEPVTTSGADNLTVTVSLDPGNKSGENADWWVVVNTPFPSPKDWYHYDLTSGWVPGLDFTHQGPLADLTPPFEVLNMSGLPIGAYTFYFGVDMVMNGPLDMGQIYYDGVVVNIIP